MANLLTLKNGELKTVTMNWKPEDFDYLSDGGAVGDLYSRVPWLYRAVTIRAQSLSRMPFSIYRGENEVDSSGNYQNITGLIPDPFSLFYLIEASLCLFGRSYLLPQKNVAGMQKGLRWLLPSSIEPIISETEGLTGWRRNLNAGAMQYPKEGLIYIWQPNPFSEIAPGQAPANAALAAAGVLRNVDKFAIAFFERGAIKSTILTVDGQPMNDQLEKLKSWWVRAMTGIRNAWGSNVFNAQVKPIVIGEGIKELESTSLTQEKREDIATALGIPHSLLFSNAANFATAQQDDVSFYDKTISPDALLIQSAINAQYFEPMGYSLQFRPESLGANQEDETARASAYAAYVNAGMRPSIAAQILGITLPEGMEFDELDEDDPEPEPQPIQLQDAQTEQPEEDTDPEDEELDKMMRKSINALNKGKSPAVDFTAKYLKDAQVVKIRAELTDCKTADDVRGVFDKNRHKSGMYPAVSGNIDELIDLLREAIRG